jgi:hypothetical protein
MKQCSRCGEEKPLSDYWKSPKTIDGLFTYCKTCHNIAKKASKYGLSFEEAVAFDEVPLCQACGDPVEGGHFSPIDHCHTTDEVRGVLCRDCNRIVRAFDNKHKLSSLLIYLWRHEERMSV